MIVSIRPWLEIADESESAGRHGSGACGWVELNSDAEMEELLRQGARLGGGLGTDCFDTANRMDFYHQPVLAREVLDALKPAVGKQIYDGTIGGGGHSELLLANGAHVIGSDQDLDAITYVTKKLKDYGDQFLPLHGNFSEMTSLLHRAGIDQVDGVLLDLGVSSHQLDEADRGFSFRKDGPLDMRMDQSVKQTAAELVNTADEAELIRIFREYGEEKRAKAVAAAIVEARAREPFVRTSQLAEVVASVIPRKGRNHPATKVFQALRIALNNELACLEKVLAQAVDMLAPGGTLAVITFHSLEDRIVKQFMRARSEEKLDRPEWPEPRSNPDYSLKLPQRKPIVPTDFEVEHNYRSRSAKLRVAVKV